MDFLLAESLEISTVLDSKANYLQWLSLTPPLTIDASRVNSVDAAGLQLLASLFMTAERAGIEITLVNATNTLNEGIALLALESLFAE
ncbi:STAS domain-containing protein [Vibrio anguillarum]|jgi:anti-anti-sigma regulatory factor|uniref:STAS domain-containing protein n=2 Tax=Vibrio TaxID=662 RepID=A0AAW4BDW6_VIBAN|nr:MULTISPECIES: STAS domain-containing protein [Vibrio]ASG02268.1 anti-anti-sigma factor [Vibrio anguillarum]ATC59984.1 STAS domain-containing protein [Vibrio anguillarum]MBF4250994.1 STAS domain-containing protein [Vibrio anguillarum]MBF4334809.1 STAS domain-containing protein [Vibrio anguillarum]MBF4388911.1 STAS domain-containing protein [Vibrio anguillarum]